MTSLDVILNPQLLPRSAADSLNTVFEPCRTAKQVADREVAPLIDATEARRDFMEFKFLVNSHRGFSLLILQNHKDIFLAFYTLGTVALSIPVSSVPCEQSFSTQNRIKSKLHNRLSYEALTPCFKFQLKVQTPQNLITFKQQTFFQKRSGGSELEPKYYYFPRNHKYCKSQPLHVTIAICQN